ncbi:hypothetical protein [Acidocella sp.]|uniref:hypothetical protein n=1 Tax=Acidocella sp. TaxID=50710 RepID=UPI00260B5A72|nr:hypothetical protein [Acidocella sp.]
MPLNLPFALPVWLPGWAIVLVALPVLLWGLAFLMMPFSVFGVKSRLESLEAQLDQMQDDLRILGMRMSGALPPVTRAEYVDDVPDFGLLKKSRESHPPEPRFAPPPRDAYPPGFDEPPPRRTPIPQPEPQPRRFAPPAEQPAAQRFAPPREPLQPYARERLSPQPQPQPPRPRRTEPKLD